MIKHIMLVPLLVGITLGIIAVIFVKPDQKIVHKYPNPEEKTKTIYKDKNGVCYTYSAKKIDCDKSEGKLKNFPLSK
jgi:hypothetical protein